MTHPIELGPAEVTRFLASLAETGGVSASTQTQALSALLFPYRDVLHREMTAWATWSAPGSRCGYRWS